MSRQQIRIEQIENVAAYCLHDASGLTPPVGAWIDYGSTGNNHAYRVNEDDIPLFPVANVDTFYFGAAAPWTVLGFRVGTITPSHAGFTIEYYDSGTAWTNLTFLADTTSGLTLDGYMTWVAPGTWTLRTINGISAFWIRVRSTGVTTAGTAHHFMPTLIGKAPLLQIPRFPAAGDRYTRDVNGVLKRKDIPLKHVTEDVVDCTQNAFAMDEINYLRYLIEYRHKCRLTDLALTDPPNFSLDAYYQYYEGYIVGDLDKTASPFKMNPDRYMLRMMVETANSIFNELGVPPA